MENKGTMERKTINIFLETTHSQYLKMANEALEDCKNEPIDNSIMRDFFMKKAAEYTNKANAIMKVRKFMFEDEYKEKLDFI
tara:strand:+ start:391 stop:636 length:246 start_codon:yes stop_codon:yes gene_type:complete